MSPSPAAAAQPQPQPQPQRRRRTATSSSATSSALPSLFSATAAATSFLLVTLLLTALPTPAAGLGFGVTSVESDVLAGAVNDYPAGLLEWSPTADGCDDDDLADYCATLEFCHVQSGTFFDDSADEWVPIDNFGYALPGSGGMCQTFNGPMIRLTAGRRYRLTLRNLSNETTNLHTHGLHVVGSGNGDDVTREVPAGECMDYYWNLQDDHPGGTNWYHAHKHGMAERQIAGGAFGFLVVEENPLASGALIPRWAYYERVLHIYSKLSDGSLIINGVRGRRPADLFVERDRWFRLRIAVVDALGLTGRIRVDGCEFRKVAHDGIWSSEVPLPAKRDYPLSASSRSDFAVRCPNAGTFPVWYNTTMAGRIITGPENATSDEVELGEWVPDLPDHLAGMREAFVPPQNTYRVHMTLNAINFKPWNPDFPLHTIQYGEVHEWDLVGTYDHPFHKHMYHVMVVSPGGCGPMHQEGEFYDTIAGVDDRGNGGCRVRFRAVDVGQREVMHCHNLPHSDFGAMAWVDVVGSNMPRNDYIAPAYRCGARVPPMTLAPTRQPTQRPTQNPTVSAMPTPSKPICDLTIPPWAQPPCEVPLPPCDLGRPPWERGRIGVDCEMPPTSAPTSVPTQSPTVSPAPTVLPRCDLTLPPWERRQPCDDSPPPCDPALPPQAQPPCTIPTLESGQANPVFPGPSQLLPLCDMGLPPWERGTCVEPLPYCRPDVFPWAQPVCSPLGGPPLRPPTEGGRIQNLPDGRRGSRRGPNGTKGTGSSSD